MSESSMSWSPGSMEAVYLTDRTTIETDWTCGRKRFYYKEYRGRGIVGKSDARYYKEGKEIHHDLALLAEGKGEAALEGIIASQPSDGDRSALESWTRRLGWFIAARDHLFPMLMRDYEVVMVERELVLESGPLWVANTADLVLREKATGKLIVVDYKTVGMLGKGWMDHWQFAIQMHINIEAVEKETGEEVSHAQVIGLRKGYMGEGQVRHPFTYAYVNKRGQWHPKWMKDAEMMGVWDYPGGPVAYLEALPAATMLEQFVFSAPIIKDSRLLRDLLHDRLRREQEVEAAREMEDDHPAYDDHMRKTFEQRFDKCRPTVGSACPFLPICHNAEVGKDPLGSGLFVVREPHHPIELVALKGEEE